MMRVQLIAGLAAALLWGSAQWVAADPASQPTGAVPDSGYRPPLCQTSLAEMQSADPGWQLLKGRSAALYTTRVIFLGAPEYDTIAYLQKGDTVLLLVSLDGCVIGHSAIPMKTHEKGIEKAIGVGA